MLWLFLSLPNPMSLEGKENIITDSNYLGIAEYEMANGSIDSCRRYKVNNVRIGKYSVNDVVVAVSEKAKKIIEIGVTKFPLDYYGYYTMVEPFADGYYKVGEKKKAQDLLNQLINKYKESLKFYSGLSSSDKTFFRNDIATDIERYRSLLGVMKSNKDFEFYNKNRATFNTINTQMGDFGRDNE